MKGFYAVPYSVAWADEMVRSHALLNEAADAVEKDVGSDNYWMGHRPSTPDGLPCIGAASGSPDNSARLK